MDGLAFSKLFVTMGKPSAKMEFIEKYRAWIVFFCVLPMSYVLRLVEAAKKWWTAPHPADHEKRVLRVCQDVRAWAETAKQKKRLLVTDRQSADSHSVRMTDKSNRHTIPFGDLRAILGVEDSPSRNGKIIRVEPGATVGEVTAYLVKRGLQLECTLEMEDATLGGLAVAQGLTTHSHVCGLVCDTVVSFDVVLADGSLVTATADNQHSVSQGSSSCTLL